MFKDENNNQNMTNEDADAVANNDSEIEQASLKELFRNKDFMRLWIAQMVSSMGDWVIVTVLFTFVLDLSGGRMTAISLMMVARFLPAVTLGLVLGVFVDKLDRKTTLIMCDICRAVLVILIPFSPNLLMVCVITFFIEVFSLIYGPAKDASLPDLVNEKQLMRANSLNWFTMYGSMAFGTAIAGVLLGFLSWLGGVSGFIGEHIDPNRAVFFINSGTFLISIALVYGIRFPKSQDEKKLVPKHVKKELKEGLRYMLNHTLTRTVLILVLACFLSGGTVYVLAVGFVRQVMMRGEAFFAYVITSILVGMMAGSVIAGLIKRTVTGRGGIGILMWFFGFGIVVFSVTTTAWLSLLVVFLAGTCMGVAIVTMITVIQEKVDEEFRGRVFVAIQTLVRSSIFIAIVISGLLADLITSAGRSIGIASFDLWIIRFGGRAVEEIDGSMTSFDYLINGPQVILLAGGIVIMLSGLYAFRSLKRYFDIEAQRMINEEKENLGYGEGHEANDDQERIAEDVSAESIREDRQESADIAGEEQQQEEEGKGHLRLIQ